MPCESSWPSCRCPLSVRLRASLTSPTLTRRLANVRRPRLAVASRAARLTQPLAAVALCFADNLGIGNPLPLGVASAFDAVVLPSSGERAARQGAARVRG